VPAGFGLAKPARPICTVLAICTPVVQLARMVEVERGDQLERAFEDALRKALPPGWEMTLESEGRSEGSGVDAYLDLVPPSGGRFRACVEFKARAEPAEVVQLVPWLQQCGAAVLVAPAVGSRTRDILADAGISWMEPEGDCRIALGSLFIERLGRDRPRRMAGAPDTRYVSDLFSGGALRVVRWLLIEPAKSWTRADMAERAGLTLGFVSRTFKTLARDAYLDRTRGSSRVRDRDALLEAWAAAPTPRESAFERVATVSGPEALLRTIPTLTAPRPYAVTAEAATDKLAPFARFSRVEIYVEDVEGWDRALGLTSVPRGGNVVLIKPVDAGVFDGSFERDGVLLASRPELYVDLVRRGGAAAEAAAFMRERGELWPQ
jgi:hypothetical protein